MKSMIIKAKRFIVKTAAVLTAISVAGACGFCPYISPKTNAETVSGWTAYSNDSDSGAVIDNDIVYSGSGSLKCYNNTKRTAEQYFSLSTTVNVKKGKTYKYGFMAKGENINRGTVFIDWGIRTSITPFQATYDWTPFEISYTHSTDAATVELRFVLDDKTDGLWLDNVYFYETENGVCIGENLIKNSSFDTSKTIDKSEDANKNYDALTKYLISGKRIPVYKADGISIDGDFSDWKSEYNVIPITGVNILNACTPDVDANIRYAWDDDYFYTAIDVTDDSFEPIEGGGFWQGDSIQISLSADDEKKNFGTEIGFNYFPDTDKSEINGIAESDIIYKAKKSGNTVFYEIAIPWTLQYGETRPESILFNALVNDCDGGIRNYCQEIDVMGISVNKSAVNNPVLVFQNSPEDTTFLSELRGESEIGVNKDTDLTVKIFNNSNQTQSYSIKCDETGEEKSVEVLPKSEGEFKLPYKPTESGVTTIVAEVSDGIQSQKLYLSVNVIFSMEIPTSEECNEMLDTLDGYVRNAESLLAECERMGYTLDYEMSDYYILERFTQMQRDKINDGQYQYITYQFSKLTEIYNALVENLKSYIDGKSKPKSAVRMVTSDQRDEIKGETFFRETEVNGNIEKRPYYYVGTGHWDYVWGDIENMRKLGYDFIHIELGPNSVIFPESFAADWDVNVLGYVPDYSVELDDKTSHSGKYSAKIINNTPYNYNNFFTVRQTVKVEPNTVYEFGMFAKGTNVSNTTKLYMGNMDYNDRTVCGGTYDWTEYSGTYKTGSNETTADVIITYDSPSTVMYIDDMYVRKQGTDTNLIKNPGFENGNADPNSIGDGMRVKYDAIERVKEVLASAEENNVAIELLITPHYFPTFLTTKDPTINDDGKVPFQFMPFNPTHPTVKKVLEKYIDIFINSVKDYKSLHSIVLSNEPAFNPSYGTYYLEPYHNYLKELYGTIENLNKAYGDSEYKSFDEIGWPKSPGANQYWVDYRTFSDKILADYHHYLSAAVKAAAPDIPVHTKIMSTFRDKTPPSIDDYRLRGTDYELWTDCLDINGNDGGAGSFNCETNDIYTVLGWYDWQTSVKNAPCINSEDHILSATDVMDYSPLQPDFCASQIWQGAIHGRSGTNIWLWDVREFGENNALLTNRPMVVSKTTKVGFDLNRAAYQVAAIQNEPRRVAILKSENSLDGSVVSINTCYNTYISCLTGGMRPMFITDHSYEKLSDYEVVFIPDMRFVSDELFDKLVKYVDDGGKLVIFGNKSLTMNPVGKARDAKAVSELFEKAELTDVSYSDNTVNNPGDIDKAVKSAIADKHFDSVYVYDKETDEPVDNVEWLYGVYDGKIVVNMCNYDKKNEKTVYLKVNGKRVESFFEHRGEQIYDTGEITLKPYQPILISIDADNPFFDTYKHWAEGDIQSIYSKQLIKGVSASRFAPDDTLTGAEFATLAARILGIELDESSDVWYDSAVSGLNKIKIAAGELNAPENAITREDVCAIAVRAYENKKGTAKAEKTYYDDQDKISSDKIEFVEKAAQLKIMNGDDNNNFNPTEFITRAEAARIINGLFDLLNN